MSKDPSQSKTLHNLRKNEQKQQGGVFQLTGLSIATIIDAAIQWEEDW
jgi:hypothetical protein